MAEAKPVQAMTLHWLDLSRVQRYTKLKLDGKPKPQLARVADSIVALFNAAREERECYQPVQVNDEVRNSFRRRVWILQSTRKAAADTALEALGAEELQASSTNHRLVIYFRTKPTREMAAVTSGDGGDVVAKCASYVFPIIFAEAALDPAKIVEIKWTSLLREGASTTALHPAAHEITKTAYLYRLVEMLRCRVKPTSSLIRLIGEENAATIVKIGRRTVRLELRLPWETYPEIFSLVSRYIRGTRTIDTNNKQERPNAAGFEFLRFLQKVSDEDFHRLDVALACRMYRAYVKEQPSPAYVSYKHLKEFLSAARYEIQTQAYSNYFFLSKSPPTIECVLRKLLTLGRSTSAKDFVTQLRKAGLRYTRDGGKQPVDGRLMEFLEGDAQIDKVAGKPEMGKVKGLKIRGMWYTISEDHLALMHGDFHRLVRRSLLPLDHQAHLPLTWIGNTRQGHVTQNHVKSVTGTGKGIRAFMERLKKAKVAFLARSGKVLCSPLKGKILKVEVIAKYRAAIDELLSSGTRLLISDFTKKWGTEEGVEIFKALTMKSRPIIDTTKDGKRYVNTPYVYPLKGDPFIGDHLEAFQELLEERYALSSVVQSEEEYCRNYRHTIHNEGKLYGADEGRLVFDQVLPHDIEFGDLVYYRDGMLFIYHVKEDFGQHTRDACSQMLNSARMVRSALSLNQAEDYLETLWNAATVGDKKGWRKDVQDQLLHLGKTAFFDLFHNGRIVYVYALLSFSNKSWHQKARQKIHFSPEQIAADPALAASQREGYLDKRGMLTGKFLASSDDRFKLKEVTDNDRKRVYKLLVAKKPISDTILAKMDLLKTEQALKEMGFEFAIDVIQRPEGHMSLNQESGDQSDDDTPLPPSQFTFPSQDASGTQGVEEEPEVWLGDGGPLGQPNIGNSCYINAALQILRLASAFLESIDRAIERNQFLQTHLDRIREQRTSCQAVLAEHEVNVKALQTIHSALEDLAPNATIENLSLARLNATKCALAAVINMVGEEIEDDLIDQITTSLNDFVREAEAAEEYCKRLRAFKQVIALGEHALDRRPVLESLRDTFYENPGTATFNDADGAETQQDAAEFLGWLFEAAGFNSFTYETVKNRVSQGETVTSQTGTILSLPVSENQSLQDLITDYFVQHPVNDNDDVISTMDRITKAPQLLILQLKRYSFDQTSQAQQKITAPIAMPEDGQVRLPIDDGVQSQEVTYAITGYINHHGNLIGVTGIDSMGEREVNRGHYTADVLMDGEWFHCDDSIISKRNPLEPEKDAYLILLRRMEGELEVVEDVDQGALLF